MPKSKKNEIIIKNEFYPKGLRENDIYTYYIKNKFPIYIGTANRNVALLIAKGVNDFVVKRNIDNSPIKITLDNYEKIIHPRVVSIFVELPSLSNMWCIDIDSGGNVSERRMKQAVKDVLEIMEKLYEDGYTVYRSYYRIISTSTGYQVFCYMNKKRSTEKNLEMALEVFEPLSKKYVYNRKKYSSDDIIIDFSPMRRRGMHICPWGLCKNGLVAMDVTNVLDSFIRKRDANIFDIINK